MQRYGLRSPEYHRPHVSISAGFPGSLGFLGNPSTVRYAVDTCSDGRTVQGYSVPGCRLALHVGPHFSPGALREAVWTTGKRVQPAREIPGWLLVLLDQANNPRRLVTPDDDCMSSSTYPYTTLLDGIRGWIPRDRLSFPLHGLMVSRYRGEGASPLPQRGGNFTRTVSQLSRMLSSSSPLPDIMSFLGNGSHLPLVSRSLGLPHLGQVAVARGRRDNFMRSCDVWSE